MRKRILVAAMLCLLLLLFAACSLSSGTSTKTDAPTAAPATAEPTAAPTAADTTAAPTTPAETTAPPTTPAPVTVPISFGSDAAQGSVAGRIPVLGQTLESGALVEKGTMVTLTATANTGYTFQGWYKGSESVSDVNPYSFIVTDDPVSLTARFTLNTYPVTYISEDNAKGTVSGTVASGSNAAYGSTVTLTASAGTGHTFSGWYKGSERVSTENPYTVTVGAEAIALQAKFSANEYALTYVSEDNAKGTVAGSAASGSNVAYGSSVTLTASAGTGYTFSGWYKGSEKVSDANPYAFTVGAEAVALQAKFTANRYAVTYISEDNAKGTVAGNVASGSDAAFGTSVTLTASAATGYTFDGWYKGSEKVSDANPYTFTVGAGAIAQQARFTANTYLLTYASENDAYGTVTGSTDSGVAVAYGSAVTLTATANTGYTFDGWYKGVDKISDANPYVFTQGTEAVSLTAKYTVQKRTVTLYDGADLYDTLSPDYGTTASLPRPTKANYEFVGWYEDRALTRAFDGRAVTENLFLFAKWERTVILYEVRFVDWDGTQIGAVQSVEQGKAAIVPANPRRTGYVFDGWSNDGYLSVTGNLTVSATYVKETYAVAFYLADDAEDPAFTQNVAYLERAAIPQTPQKDGFLFAGWKWNGYDFDFSTTADEPIDLYAAWTPKPADTFTVRFWDGDDGDKVLLDTQTVEQGKAAKSPESPSRTGLRFLAWDVAFNEITSDLDVHATYETATFTVTFRFFEGDVERETEQTVAYGAAAAAPANYARTGYDFVAWDKAFNSVTADLTVTASYRKKTFTASFYNGLDLLTTVVAAYGESFAIPETPQVAGYSFLGWYADAELSESFDFTVAATASVSVYGRFEKIVVDRFTVRFVDYNGTEISRQTVVSGNSAIAPGNPARTGYTFTGWDREFAVVTADLTVTATYSINSYSVKFYAEDRTSLLADRTVPYGTDATSLVTPPTVQGKTFLRWSADLSSVSKDTTVYAIYDAHVVEVRFMDGEDVLIRQAVRYGQTASVPNTPTKVDYIFKGWYADAECTEVYDFNTLIENEEGIEIYAKWEEASGVYSVYFKDYDGRIWGNVQRVMAGLYAIEPSAPEKDGYVFEGWYIENTDTRFDFDTMTVNGSLTLVARGTEE